MKQEQHFHNAYSPFPFCAVVGHEKAKQALIMLAVNERLHSVLLSGPRGTGKTVLARSFPTLLPSKRHVNVPLNVTDDRLLGSIDVEHALKTGERRHQLGLLAQAHRHIVTVDDSHLMEAAAVHAIATAISTGEYAIEREGLSVSYPAKGLLVATMNPQEGDLSASLLDRFSMVIHMPCLPDVAHRQLITRHAFAYEQNPHGFIARWDEETQKLRASITEAKLFLPSVVVSEDMLQLAALTSAEARCAGHRADYYLVEAARAIAALDKRTDVEATDIRQAAELVLFHRMRREQTDERRREAERQPEKEQDTVEQQPDNSTTTSMRQGERGRDDAAGNEEKAGKSGELSSDLQQGGTRDDLPAQAHETVASIGQAVQLSKWFVHTNDDTARKGAGKSNTTKSVTKQGRYVKAVHAKVHGMDIAFDATLRAAAPYQKIRPHQGETVWSITENDLRYKLREKRTGVTLLFVVDASRSMAAGKRMQAVKGAIFSLLRDAYQKRDRVGMVAFRQEKAHEVLPITRSIDLAEKRLRVLPTGGKTPLVHGLQKGYELLRQAMWRDREIVPVMIVLTDGKANVGLHPRASVQEVLAESRRFAEHVHAAGIQSLLIDTEQSFVKLHLAEKLARAMHARYCRLDDLSGSRIAHAVRTVFNQ